jgi:hypothetical protein
MSADVAPMNADEISLTGCEIERHIRSSFAACPGVSGGPRIPENSLFIRILREQKHFFYHSVISVYLRNLRQ